MGKELYVKGAGLGDEAAMDGAQECSGKQAVAARGWRSRLQATMGELAVTLPVEQSVGLVAQVGGQELPEPPLLEDIVVWGDLPVTPKAG